MRADAFLRGIATAVDGALVDQDAALGQPLTDFCVTEAVAHVPADSEVDYVPGKARHENAESERRVKRRPQ